MFLRPVITGMFKKNLLCLHSHLKHLPIFYYWYRYSCCAITHWIITIFLGPHQQHMEVPRLEVESELWLSAYATATAMPDPSLVCHLHHSSQQYWIVNPLSKARDQTCILMETSQICFRWATTETSSVIFWIGYIVIQHTHNAIRFEKCTAH